MTASPTKLFSNCNDRSSAFALLNGLTTCRCFFREELLTLDTIRTTAAPEIAPAIIDPARTAISSNKSDIFHFSQV